MSKTVWPGDQGSFHDRGFGHGVLCLKRVRCSVVRSSMARSMSMRMAVLLIGIDR